MADEWIKYKRDLPRDPKVIAMANWLTEKPEFWSFCYKVPRDEVRDIRVTARVTVSVTIGGLLRVWSVVRAQGRRDGDDMILENTTLDTVTIIADTPCFGEAMARVRWAVVEPDGQSVRFPKCYQNLTSPEERKREAAADRKRRQREREAENGECDSSRRTSRPRHAMSRPREEKRRVEKKSKTPPPPTIPPELDTPEFLPLWEKWRQHRREIGHALKPTTEVAQFKKLAEMGVKRAVAAVRHSIEQGWQGLYEPDAKRQPVANGNGRIDELFKDLDGGKA